MLSKLLIQNFILIDNLELDLKEGLTCITGETGAGKSLLFDALNLLSGAKASKDIIRYGQSKAIVEATFDNLSNDVIDILNDLDIDTTILIFRREVLSNGKSFIKVNNVSITNQLANQISLLLFDIHVQNDTLRLFNPLNYLSFIDDSQVIILKAKYTQSLNIYLEKLNNYIKLVDESKKSSDNLEYLKYQYNEINDAQLVIGEKEKLESEIKVLNNYEEVFELLSNISSIDKEYNLVNNLYELINNVSKLESIDNKYSSYLASLNESYYSIKDLIEYVNHDLLKNEYDQSKIDNINNRLSLINHLEKKYKKDITSLIEYKNNLLNTLNNYDNIDYYIELSYKELILSFNNLKDISYVLSNKRKEISEKLKVDIINNLKELLLDKVNLEFVFTPNDISNPLNKESFTKNGIDKLDILITFNKGEPLKPLSKCASGGEMSRVMLALKNCLYKQKNLQIILFDEIDTGLSGIQASKVAESLESLSKTCQVLAITHIPLVASKSNNHLNVYKEVINNETITSIKELSYDERINKLASMINPFDTSAKSIDVAKMLLER